MSLEAMRCSNCGALLARHDVRHGKIELKCGKCNQMVVLIVTDRTDPRGPGYEKRGIA